mgnify:CR=1 FL=1
MIKDNKLFHYGKCAHYAYNDDAKTHYKKLGYTNCKFIEHDGAQAYIVSNTKHITICFRGTEPKEFNDIKADLNFLWSKGFHKGFYKEFLKLQKSIELELDRIQKRKAKPIHIVGHSLGGGIATVAAYHISGVEEVVTFGSPRATTWWKQRSCPILLTRVVNNNDVVPRVPFAILGFKHAGKLQYINYYGNWRPLTPWQRFKDQWRSRVRAFKKGVPFDGLYDHSMVQYNRYLKIED